MRALPRYSIKVPSDVSDEIFYPWTISQTGVNQRTLWRKGHRRGWEECEDAWLDKSLDLTQDRHFEKIVPGGSTLVEYTGYIAGYQACINAIRTGDFLG